jgi:hypothetical protein
MAVKRAHRASAQPAAIHDAGIELDLTKEVRETGLTDTVNLGIGFNESNAGHDGINGRSA